MTRLAAFSDETIPSIPSFTLSDYLNFGLSICHLLSTAA